MDPRVTQVIELMKERLHADASIERLAAEVELSTSRLAYLFRQETGRSPGAYLHALRMERARILIGFEPHRGRVRLRQEGVEGDRGFFAVRVDMLNHRSLP